MYTGYTTDISRRVDEHNTSKKAAHYTRGRRPVQLVYSESYTSRSSALRRECEIKKLSSIKKKLLVGSLLSFCLFFI